ncbi:MAG: hypothetical protein OEX03_10015 [Gammaproteobacteria bacterium]|nr:hypothetical protein [Gammaproteobacteria bacterium]
MDSIWRLGEQQEAGEWSIIPVEAVRLENESGPVGVWLHVELEAVAVLICQGKQCHALDMQGDVIAESLIRDRVNDSTWFLAGLNWQ